MQLQRFSEHKYNPVPALPGPLKQQLTDAFLKEKKTLSNYFKDSVHKKIKQMSIKRPDFVEERSELALAPNQPVCKECAKYIQGQVIAQHFNGERKASPQLRLEAKPEEKPPGVVGALYKKVRQLKFM